MENKGSVLETEGLRTKGGEGRMEGGGWKMEKCPPGFRAGFFLQFSRAILRWRSCRLLQAEPWGGLLCDPRGGKVFQGSDHLSCKAA